jgi:hypothetical protein
MCIEKSELIELTSLLPEGEYSRWSSKLIC